MLLHKNTQGFKVEDDLTVHIIQKKKVISYLHQCVRASSHECVHYAIKSVVVRISSHMANSFTCGTNK